MPTYIGSRHRDTKGNIGPTLQSIKDKHDFAKAKGETMSDLASLFAPLGATLGTYSPEAHGGLMRPSNLSPATMTAVSDAKRRGASAKEILQRWGLVHDGFGWNQYVPDKIDDRLLESFYGKKHPIGTLINPTNSAQTMTLKDIVSNTRTPDVKFTPKDIPIGKDGLIGGAYEYGGSGAGEVLLNTRSGRYLKELRGSLGHELQHPLDHRIEQRSFGTNPNSIPLQQRVDAAKRTGRNDVSNVELYAHQAGERRADINGFMAAEGPENYQDIQGVFDHLNRRFQYDPRLNNGQ